jgi:phosphoribosylamine--glycine ligase
MYNVLLLGAGGREHALAWKLSQSQKLAQLFIAPGNPGTAALGENLPIAPTDFAAIKAAVIAKHINMVVAGPEDPLVNGLTDFFAADPQLAAIPVIGPCQQGARLEGSKDFAKRFMQKYSIPTARHKTITPETLPEGTAFIDELPAPYVLKADGLAAGKGVLIIDSREEAKRQLQNMLHGLFGMASRKVVIEEFLPGIEVSVFALTDGKSYKLLPEAKDYKRIGEQDTGLNTGGMGAVSPVPFATPAFLQKVETRILQPTIKGLQAENILYKGFLFIGLMNVNGDPYVIEYNVRMGDPETEAVMPRLQSDLLDLFEGVACDTLHTKPCDIAPQTALTVVCVSGGYPEAYQKGFPVSGLPPATAGLVFHAGTALKQDTLVTAGGRVLAVTSLAESIPAAQQKTYATLADIAFEGMYFRRDIGNDLTKR